MPTYEIRGVGKDTGRKRKRIFHASSAQKAREMAAADGTFVEELVELPPEPPTQKQIDFAIDLGIKIPPGATKQDLSDLISLKVDKDKPSTERHRLFAKQFGVQTTEYIGKRALFNVIKYALSEPGRENELAAWFTYRVYRELVHGAENAKIKGPDNAIIKGIASQLANDPSVVKSIKRYEGRDLIWFGEWTAPNGRVYTGGSNRTIAYKKAAGLLKEKITFSSKSADQTSKDKITLISKNTGNDNEDTYDYSFEVKTKSSGCMTVIAVVILISVFFILLLTT